MDHAEREVTLPVSRAYKDPENVEQARHRKAMRIAPVYPMAPVREGATPEELAAFLEADYTNREYLAVYREYGFMHPLLEAMYQYRAVAQTVHERMEWTNEHVHDED